MDFDFDLVHDQTVRSIRVRGRQVNDKRSMYVVDLRIEAETHTLVLSVNPDTDEIVVSLEPVASKTPLGAEWRDLPELGTMIGRRLGWIWEGRNYRGYWDCLLLSMDGLNPDFCFVGIASSIEIRKLSAVAAQAE